MHLKVLCTTLPVIVRINRPVSLMTNGRQIEINDAKNFTRLVSVHSPEIVFHTEDEKTEIELTGYYHVDDHEARAVSFLLG